MKTISRLRTWTLGLSAVFCIAIISATASAQTTYTWNQTGSASWAVSTNWTPTRTTPATNDILVFNNGATTTVTAVPTQTIGQLSVSGNTTVNLQANAAGTILTISGGTGTDLSVASGSALNINGTNTLSIAVGAGATGSISGSMSVSIATETLTAADASGITFNSGATFTQNGTGTSGNVFGSGTANSVVFASGSTFVQKAGANPFQKTQPASVVVFQTGSLFSFQENSTPSFSGRTYANLEINFAAASFNGNGGGALSIDNLTITAGSAGIGMTGTFNLKGNISVASGATLNFNPASAATVTLNGSSAQTITNSGTLTFGVNQTVNVNNANGITLGSNISITAGALTLTSGTISTGANTLSIGSAVTVSRTSGYVIGNLLKTYAAVGSKTFEVGTANGYSPVAVNITAGTFPADFTVKAVQGAQPNINDPTKALQRYWTLTATGVTADLTFNYLDADVPMTANENNFIVVKYNGAFSIPSNQTVTPASNQATVTSVSSFSDWTLAEPSAPNAVALNGFTAEGLAVSPSLQKGGVLLRWQTGMEVANLGFNVYRDEAGKRTRLTPNLIAGSALFVGARTTLGAGRSYVWRDSGGASANAQYWLEEIDLNGNSYWHGPLGVSSGKLAADVYEPNSRLLNDLGGEHSSDLATPPVERRAATKRATAAALISQQALTGISAVKITVNRESWYQVKAAELVAAGLDARVNPQMLQLFVDGREQPINVLTDRNGLLAGIEFYGMGSDSLYTAERAYLLTAGTSLGKRIRQVKSTGDAAAGGSFLMTVERRDRTLYFPALRNGDKENFFGAVVARDAVEQPLTLARVNRAAPTMAALEVALQGVTSQAHSVMVELNGSPVGTVAFANQAAAVAVFNVAHALLREGANTVRLVPAGGASDISLVDYLRVSYQHYNTADSDALRLTAAGKQPLLIDGFSQPAVRVLDVTDAGAAQELTGTPQTQQNGYGLSLLVPGAGERRLLAVAGELIRPLRVSASPPSSWRQRGNAADLLIVTRGDFAGALDSLVAQRRRQGLSVAVVDIEAVYNEFSFGQKTPQALKDFLAYAATSWKKKPRYVLLVGDASYDSKNYLGTGDFDLVPTKLFDSDYLETASDDWLVDFNNDGMPELAIGRLPARTAGEALTMATKIVRYDSQSSADTLLLVSDQNDTYDFAGASAALRDVIPPEARVQSLHRGDTDDATTQAQLISAINRGQRVVNYFGHASVDIWRGNLLTGGNISDLVNSNRLTVFMMMSCLNGYFHDPALDSLGAALLKSERGGAVAVWASSGMTLPGAQTAMNQEATRLLLSKPGQRLGDAMLQAKAAATAGDVRRTWILFGDPTTKLH